MKRQRSEDAAGSQKKKRQRYIRKVYYNTLQIRRCLVSNTMQAILCRQPKPDVNNLAIEDYIYQINCCATRNRIMDCTYQLNDMLTAVEREMIFYKYGDVLFEHRIIVLWNQKGVHYRYALPDPEYTVWLPQELWHLIFSTKFNEHYQWVMKCHASLTCSAWRIALLCAARSEAATMGYHTIPKEEDKDAPWRIVSANCTIGDPRIHLLRLCLILERNYKEHVANRMMASLWGIEPKNQKSLCLL